MFTEFGKTEREAIWGGDTGLRVFLGFRTLRLNLRHPNEMSSELFEYMEQKFRSELQNGDRNAV